MDRGEGMLRDGVLRAVETFLSAAVLL